MSNETRRRAGAAGFTLLEVVVALAVFALIGAASYRLLDTVTRSRGVVADSFEQRSQLERGLLVIEQDLLHLLPRSVREPDAPARAAALSNRRSLLEFSRGGLPLPRSLWRDGVARVVYELDDSDGDGSLYRVVYRALDRLDSTGHYRQELLRGVAAVKLRFMEPGGGWAEQWPPPVREEQASGTSLSVLPAAVELTLQLLDEREIVKLVSLR